MRLAVVLLVVGCATEPDEDLGPTVISKVAYKDLPVSAGQMLSLPSPCWDDVPLVVPYDCSVSLFADLATETVVVASCELFPDARPCWRNVVDEQNCYDAGHQKLEIVRSEPAGYNHHVVATCVSY